MLNRVIMMGRLAHTPEVKDGELTIARLRLHEESQERGGGRRWRRYW